MTIRFFYFTLDEANLSQQELIDPRVVLIFCAAMSPLLESLTIFLEVLIGGVGREYRLWSLSFSAAGNSIGQGRAHVVESLS